MISFKSLFKNWDDLIFNQPVSPEGSSSYWLTRDLFLRFFGLIYFIAFLSLINQFRPLIVADGLLPVNLFLENLSAHFGQGWSKYIQLPSLFWLNSSDNFMYWINCLGLILSVIVVAGYANAIIMTVLWVCYMSFVHVGQLFYGYGWETMVLETGFLSIFLCPLIQGAPFPKNAPPALVVIWFIRWELFRVMFGAGLIKLRGDQCWRDLTCLAYHYETQPIPNPVSWYLHQMPMFVHKLGTFWNHFIELIVPWFLMGPRKLRIVAGLLLISFQGMLIISGNLSWLNWLTIALCVPCFDDKSLKIIYPKKFIDKIPTSPASSATPLFMIRKYIFYLLTALILFLSINPVRNMLSPNQAMNRSYDPFHIVNTYGAFGAVGKSRMEVILQGTYDTTLNDHTQWVEYEFKCKPGDIHRRPCVISPYHYRLDWQIWFAAMSDYRHNPWLVHFIYKLLQGNQGALSLLANNPFDRGSPKFIRAELYEYRFTRFEDQTDDWWQRKRIAAYLPPLSSDNPSLQQFLRNYGWLK